MVPEKSELTLQVERDVLGFFQDLEEPSVAIAPRDLIDKLVKEKYLSDVLIREAIWHLIDYQEIKLTDDLKLQLEPK